jgi:ATP-dependent RNA helicase DHX57
LTLYPDEITTTTNIDNSVAEASVKNLQALGFKLDQSKKAVAFISETSAFTKNFTENLTPLEASIEYLLLHTPEVDLPKRFIPAINSSNPFITDTHSGTENLKRRWFEESMAKEGGWPLYLVKEELAAMPSGVDHPGTLVSKLGARLLGKTESIQWEGPTLGDVDPDEIEAYGGMISPGRMIIPLPISPFTLHIFTPENASALLCPPAVHISSQTAPAYIRLHILSRMLRAVDEGRLFEAGETFVGACLRIIEEEWADIEDNGPPDIAQVLNHITPHKRSVADKDQRDDEPFIKPGRKKERSHKADDRTDAQVKADFEKLCASERYRHMLTARKQLPAFSAREIFLVALENNRVVVVVGETGNLPSPPKTK